MNAMHTLTASTRAADYFVRPAQLCDAPHLQDLAAHAYSVTPELAALWFAAREYRSRMRIFGEGQFVAVERGSGHIVGCTSGMRFQFDPDRAFTESWEHTTDEGRITTHDPHGEWMYGVETFVHPGTQGGGVGGMLMAARFEVVRRLNLRGIVAGSLIMGYGEVADSLTAEQYVAEVVAGSRFDPNLSKQIRKGFVVRNLIPNYTTDPRSRDYGVAMVWSNPDYRPAARRALMTPRRAAAAASV